ncbi:uncharacterized protein [Watersipora subatra]|uniref:uncharacterized protein n=1 Tax=Watersipora subatra TaxID=2589382 RepID=UPI00355BDB1C
MSDRLVEYSPPSWASHLKHIPTHTVKLAMTPTPIQRWKLPGAPESFQVFVKRDDLTGSLMSGNKVRKLEFLLAEAMVNSCKHVITTGAVTSNHCRATAVACAELGLKAHLCFMSNVEKVSDLSVDGNMLINTLVGADMRVIDTNSFPCVQQHMEKLASEIKESSGEKSSIVPTGGSNLTGIWGYLQCFQEIQDQSLEFDDLVCVCGSVATVSGLAIANYLCGSPYKIHGVKVGVNCDANEIVNDMLAGLGITGVSVGDIVSLYEGYEGLGYARSQPLELELIAQVAAATGIILDTTYTGKAAFGMYELMSNRPEVFKGRRILFLHSGGAPSLHTAAVSSALLPHTT